MRELRLKYVIQMVSDIAGKAKTDERALTLAQTAVQNALKKTQDEAGLLERVLLRVARVGSRSAAEQADYIARLAMRYQELRRSAEAAANAMQKAAAFGAGAAAGAYAVDSMTRKPMDYETRVAQMANTAFNDRDARGRIEGMRTLDAAIAAAVRMGGGTREQAADALERMIGSGAMSRDSSLRALPTVMRASTASGASPLELANIGLRVMQNFKLTEAQIPEALNVAMVGGQAGGFELRDMARELPSILAAAGELGMSGMGDFRRIIASLQTQTIVAGSTQEAATNLLNLLGKIQSPDVANNLAKFSVDGTKRLMADRARNVNPLDSFLNLVDEIVSRDSEYKRLQGELQKAGTPGERTATLTAMAKLLQGSVVGKVIQDRQGLMGLVAEQNNREFTRRVLGNTQVLGTGEFDTSFEVMSSTTGFKTQQAANAGAIAAQRAFEVAGPALGYVASTAAKVSEEFPNLSAALVGATGVVIAFGAALGASGLIGIFTGRAGNAGGVIGTAGTLAAGAAAGGVASLWRSNGWALRAGASFMGPLLGAGLDAYSAYNDASLSAAGRNRAYAAAGAGAVGGWGGAALGAGLGSMVFPGVGTLIGAGLGGLGGYFAGRTGLEWAWGRDPARDLVGGDGASLLGGNRLEIGKGQVDLNVRVHDERVSFDMASQSPPGLMLLPGNTNPAGYGATP